MIDHGPAARAVATLLEGVSEDQLAGPTPCADTSVAGLLDHLLGLTLGFRMAAEKSTGPDSGTPRASADDLDPDWRTVLPQRLDALVAAWRDPAAWEGTTWAGGVELPAPAMAGVAVDELIVHGWDLARATGQPYAVDEASLLAALRFVSSVPDDPDIRRGLFEAPVPVPDDAPLLDRLVGLTGRDPAWTPDR